MFIQSIRQPTQKIKVFSLLAFMRYKFGCGVVLFCFWQVRVESIELDVLCFACWLRV